MFKELVRKEYAVAVEKSTYATAELKRSLRSSARVPAFIDRLSDELHKADLINAQRGVIIRKETIIGLIHDMTDHWLFMLEEKARQGQLSAIAAKELETRMDEKYNPEKCIRQMGIVDNDEDPEGPQAA